MSKKKIKSKGQKLTARQLQGEVFRLFKRNPKKRYNPKQICRKLKVDNNRDSVEYAIQKLMERAKIVEVGDYKFQLSRDEKPSRTASRSGGDRREYEGIVDMTRAGSAFIVIEDLENDVFVHARKLNGALNGDKVKIEAWFPRGRAKAEGVVTEVITRSSDFFMGIFKRSKKYGFVVSEKETMPVDIYVDLANINEAQDGELVVVRITEWHDGIDRSPEGIITSVLGEPGSNDNEMKSILINNGFELDFPDEVIEESESLSADIPKSEIKLRRDMRKVTTFTIDPDTAKDFDDALSLEYKDDGTYEIGVHIADVSYYVKEGSALDVEAYKRSTSVYLVDRVLPMLPERLSNELCSLRPNEDKCTFSAVFTFDKNDKLASSWFGKTVIHSDRRFAYEGAQEVMDTGEGDYASELKKLDTLAKKLRKKRFKNGSIDFDAEEVKFRLDENGKPIEAFVKKRIDAHMLIEEFMLLANKGVAKFINEKSKGLEIPFVYRIHDEPDPDKVQDLAKFAKEMGVDLDISTPDKIAAAYNRLTKEAKTNDAIKLLEPIAIRTMSKAVYSTNNIGHYGLGFSFYSHFTSPIRRYSDVLTHRILEQNLADRTLRVKKDPLEEKCKHISSQERKATTAERESIKYKQVEFIKDHIGEEYEAVVSGIIDRGIFVEIKENKCEGMVGFETMTEVFDVPENRLKAVGKRTGKTYKMGDTIWVQVTGADLARRRIEMELADAPEGKEE